MLRWRWPRFIRRSRFRASLRRAMSLRPCGSSRVTAFNSMICRSRHRPRRRNRRRTSMIGIEALLRIVRGGGNMLLLH